MLSRGFAWWYHFYAKKDAALALAETKAKGAARVLWADKAPVPRRGFRKQLTVAHER